MATRKDTADFILEQLGLPDRFSVKAMFGGWGFYCDDLFFAMADWTIPPPGTAYTSIAGPLAFTFDNTKIAPRTADDIQPAP